MIVCGDEWHDLLAEYIAENGGGFARAGSQLIGLVRDNVIDACVMFDWHNGASIYMHVAATGKNWLTREYMSVCFNYAFTQLSCRVIIGLVADSNLKAIRFNRHLGFVENSRIKDADPQGDTIIFIMHKEQCKYLRLKNGKAKSS